MTTILAVAIIVIGGTLIKHWESVRWEMHNHFKQFSWQTIATALLVLLAIITLLSVLISNV